MSIEVSARYLTLNAKKPQAIYLGFWGGAKENRTPDLFHAMEALYQLSYSPAIGCHRRRACTTVERRRRMVLLSASASNTNAEPQ